MIKHWRLFDNITLEQIKQLDTAGIYVKVEDDVSEIEFPLAGKVHIVKGQDVYITTAKESQETLLHIMFSDRLRLTEVIYSNDQEYRP